MLSLLSFALVDLSHKSPANKYECAYLHSFIQIHACHIVIPPCETHMLTHAHTRERNYPIVGYPLISAVDSPPLSTYYCTLPMQCEVHENYQIHCQHVRKRATKRLNSQFKSCCTYDCSWWHATWLQLS